MAYFARFVANAYATADVTTGVASASPHQLTLMLYDAALKHMDKAHAHMAAGRIPEKGAAITRAIGIVEEGLKGTLDLSQGELAHNLKSLYEYINICLLKATVRNDAALLAEARALLAGMRNTWAEIAPVAGGKTAPSRPHADYSRLGVAAA
jgi:flagellar protein FliS